MRTFAIDINLPLHFHKMKKALFSLLTIIAMVMMTSCGSNDTEKKLNGKWETSVNQAGQELNMTWEFNADTHKADLSINVATEGTNLMTMSFTGSWKATEDKIAITIDEDNCSVKFSDEFKQLAEVSGVNLDDLEKETVAEFKKEVDGMAQEEIVSLTDDTLVVKEGTEKITFKRVK